MGAVTYSWRRERGDAPRVHAFARTVLGSWAALCHRLGASGCEAHDYAGPRDAVAPCSTCDDRARRGARY